MKTTYFILALGVLFAVAYTIQIEKEPGGSDRYGLVKHEDEDNVER
jgi:hypothetical protein